MSFLAPTVYKLYPPGPVIERPGSIQIAGSSNSYSIAFCFTALMICSTNFSGAKGSSSDVYLIPKPPPTLITLVV